MLIKLNVLLSLVCVVMLIVVLSSSKSCFVDPNNIRRYVVGNDGSSLDDKVYGASKSNLTGTRDVPVFFQDYDYEMVKNANGISTSRESMKNRDPASEIEKRFGA